MGNKTEKVNQIIIDFGIEIFSLESDTPNLDELVKTITKNRDKIEPKNITVKSDIENFDTESFTKILKSSIEKYIEDIKLNREIYDKIISEIKSNK